MPAAGTHLAGARRARLRVGVAAVVEARVEDATRRRRGRRGSRATAAAFAACRSTRRWSVRRPRSARKQSNGPGTAPIAFWRNRSRSATAGSRVTATPRTVSLWPARYFVAEWKTMSAPRSSGRWSAGEANVLSTTTQRPHRAVAVALPDGGDGGRAMSTIFRSGFVGRLEPDEPRPLGQRLPQRVRVAGEVDVPRRRPRSARGPSRGSGYVPPYTSSPTTISSPGAGQLGDRRGRRRAGREGDPNSRRPRGRRPPARSRSRVGFCGPGVVVAAAAAGRRRPARYVEVW